MFEGFAALDEGLAVGDQALEFDRADFGAVLFVLALLLPVFVVFKLALHAGGLFVEEIGQVPEKIVEVRLEACVAEGAGKDVEEVRDCACNEVGIGKRAGIGLVPGRLIAVEFEVLDHASGGGTAMRGFEVVSGRHWFLLLGSWWPPLAALMARLLPGARAGAAPRALARGRNAVEDGEGPFILVRDAKRTPISFLGGAAAENKRTSAVALRTRLRHPRHTQRPRGGERVRRVKPRMTSKPELANEAAPL